MKPNSKNRFITMLLIGALAVMAPSWAMALTPACTTINNTATINFTVGGVSQTPGTSTTASFTVGNKINVAVVTTDVAAVSVAPSSTTRTLTFTVTNTGNFTQDYTITAAAKANGTANPFGGLLVDNFDGTNLAIPTATVDNLAPDGTATVTITADIPAGQLNNDLAVYTLTATTLAADGTAIPAHNGNGAVKNTDGTTACTADFVYADAAGTAGDGDNANDGKGSARDAYKVTSAILSFTKTATTIWDPVNYDSSPKAIPGALIRYTITVTNDAAATSSAVLTTITDGLNANTTIDPDLKVAANNGPLAALANESAAGSGFKVTVGGTSTRAGFPKYYTTTSSADGVDIAGQNITATMTTALPVEGGYPTAGELKAGESVTITFNVTIN